MGVLWTVHAERGVDAVPVVYVVDEDGCVGVHGCRVRGLGRTGAVLYHEA